MADSVITDEMRRMVGVESAESVAEVTAAGCRAFARAVGHTDLIFYDAAVAKQRGYRDVVAPPGYLGTPVYRPSGGDESESPGGGVSIPYKRVLNGGTTYEYFEPVVAGDVITLRGKITEYVEREGSIGPMLIAFREISFTRDDGVVVAKMYANRIHY